MSYGLSVLVSDIPENREVELPNDRYFRCGDVNDLCKKMEILLNKELTEVEKRNFNFQLTEKYNWSAIAEQTIEVYKKAMNR